MARFASRRRSRRTFFDSRLQDSHEFGLGFEALEERRLLANTPPGDFDVLVTVNTGSTVARGGTDTITSSELLTEDSDTPPSGLVYIIDSAPVNGALRLNGSPTGTFTQADINANAVTYVNSGSAAGSDSFSFSVTDGTTTVANNEFFFIVTAVPGAPALSINTGSSVVRGGTDVISSSELTTTDSNTGAAQLTYTVTTSPSNGTVRVNGASSNSFTQADINAGIVTYVHDNTATTSDSFGFSVTDGTTTLTNKTFAITVTAPPAAPVITTNIGSTVARGGTDVISNSELSTSDNDTAPSGLTYNVTTPPLNGTLRRNGVQTTTFTQADINAGLITYVHDSSATSGDSFGFSVSDGTTTLTNKTFAITVTSPTGLPIISTNIGSTVTRGGTDVIAASELTTTDSNTGPEQLLYSVTSLPFNGSIRLNGNPVTQFTQADINAGIVTYVHNSSATSGDSFGFSVTDGTTTLTNNIFAITVTSATGVPTITTNTGSSVVRGGTDAISTSELNTTDSNTAPAQLVYSVTTLPVNGTIRLNGSPVTQFTQADINAGIVTYVHNSSATSGDSFGFSVTDGTTTLTNNTFAITVTSVTGTPTITTNTGSTVTRGGTDTILASELTTSDANTGAAQLLYTLTALPTRGTLRVNGSSATTFTQADINAGLVTYAHSGTATTSDSFVFNVSDGTTTLSNNTFAFTVIAPPGSPVIATNAGSSVPRGGTDVISSTELNTTDTNTDAAQLVYTVTTLPPNGSVRLNGLPTNTFTQADINAAAVTYVHNGTATTTDSFVFSVSDGTTALPGNTFSITVTFTAGAPVITTNTGSSVTRGGTDVIASSELTATDTNSSPDQLVYIVTTPPANGTLRRGTAQVSVFTQADINAGLITYVHNGSATTSDRFIFSITDGTNSLPGSSFVFTIQSIAGLSVVDGKLTMEGSNENDAVTITGLTRGTGEFQVTAQRGNQPALTQTVTGVREIVVNLHGGNDRLTMNNVLISGIIDVHMETGDDTVVLGNQTSVSSGTLRVDLGADNDTLDAKRLFIATDQIIDGGDGNDSLIFDGLLSPVFTLGTSAAGNAVWSGGAGHDLVHVIYGFVVGSWTIDMGDGSDMLDVFGSAVSGNVQALGRAGSDSMRIDTNFFDANVLIDGGSDSDFIFLGNGTGTDSATISGGDGADLITVQNQTASVLQMNTGAGTDAIEVRSSALDRFFAQLGDDNDSLTIRGNLSRLETSLDGGTGAFDRLLDLGNSFFGTFSKSGFEL